MKKASLAERIADKVTPVTESGCHVWLGASTNGGYGHLKYENKYYLAHRVTYIHRYGAIPEGLDLDHLCRVRCCVNPDHLEPVSRRENLIRGNTAIARNVRRTQCPNGHPYTKEHLAPWRNDRVCRTCLNKNRRAAYVTRKQKILGRK